MSIAIAIDVIDLTFSALEDGPQFEVAVVADTSLCAVSRAEDSRAIISFGTDNRAIYGRWRRRGCSSRSIAEGGLSS